MVATPAPSPASGGRGMSVRDVTLLPDHFSLPGTLAVPTDAVGVVVFAHGSGSSRLSPRNVEVAAVLHAAVWRRFCSTCSPMTRQPTGGTSLTSRSSQAGS